MGLLDDRMELYTFPSAIYNIIMELDPFEKQAFENMKMKGYIT